VALKFRSQIAALKEIVGLWDAGDGTPEADRMETLAILVEDYEANHFSFPPMAPGEILHYAIKEMGHTQNELADILGSRSRASEVLAGKRHLTVEAIAKISSAWRIPANLLLGIPAPRNTGYAPAAVSA
jgi:HTH-type transcriptional regulator/antitoxin HigA